MKDPIHPDQNAQALTQALRGVSLAGAGSTIGSPGGVPDDEYVELMARLDAMQQKLDVLGNWVAVSRQLLIRDLARRLGTAHLGGD